MLKGMNDNELPPINQEMYDFMYNLFKEEFWGETANQFRKVASIHPIAHIIILTLALTPHYPSSNRNIQFLLH
jgi:hypothetical protein